ncbi:MAG TPA: PilZ domain-containing protein [Patescibacteria group bacterium]|nr:PilZ domain-containing protein [Patescibacteria group bacterium]
MIIQTILNKLGLGDGSLNKDAAQARRRHVRHPAVSAEVVVADRVFNLKDWSMGGFFFDPPPGSALAVGDRVQFHLRFRLPNETVTITQPGRIVRAVRRGLGAEFAPLNPETKRKFERVLDGFHAMNFLASQKA